MIRAALAVVVAAVLCVPALAGQSATARVGDVIGLSVVGHIDYSADLTVATDGTISGPGFQDVVAQGKTLGQIRSDITARLRDYVRDPQVFVWFKSQAAAFVHVVGTATTSGPIRFFDGIDLRRVLASAGVNRSPDTTVRVFRNGEVMATYDLDDLLRDDAIKPVPLKPNDTVVVLPADTVRVWMVGPFARQGEVDVRAGSTVAQAISAAGGYSPALTNQESGASALAAATLAVRRGTETRVFSTDLGGEASIFAVAAGDTVTLRLPERAEVSVLGEVRSPGRYVVEAGAPPASAVAAAGGIQPDGTMEAMLVYRDGEVFRIDQSGLAAGLAPKPFALKAGDTVYVRRNERAVYVLGEVVAAGKYVIPDGASSYRASDAFAAARGLNPRGSTRRAVLMRPGADGKYKGTVFHLDEFLKDGKIAANPELKAGDILYFGRPNGMSLRELLQFASPLILIDSLFQRVSE